MIATTTMGFESGLAREIRALGIEDVQVDNGKVSFVGQLTDICRANIHLRLAGRIYVQMAAFEAKSFDQLYEQALLVAWEDWIGPEDQCPVAQATSLKSTLFSRSDCQAIVKKAIVDRLARVYGRANLPETGAMLPVRVQINRDQVLLSIDSSGSGLNKRGYRVRTDQAPLRETLAAGLIDIARWYPEKETLLDPFCGSGTLLIEAALKAKHIAPGLNRAFNAEAWKMLSRKDWDQAREQARDLIDMDATCEIIGSDINERAVQTAKASLKAAGVTGVTVRTAPFQETLVTADRGKIITNPPYGERLGEKDEIEALYGAFGAHLREHYAHWRTYILTSFDEFEDCFGQKARKNRKVFNGGIECRFYQYY